MLFRSMDAISQKIIQYLPLSHRVSRRKSAEAYEITFVTKWDLLAFFDDQMYKERPDEAVKTAITLTGSAKDAQALTCAQYLCQTWPSAGHHTIQLVQDVLNSVPGNQSTCKFPGLECS